MLGQYVDLVRDAGVRNFFVTALDNRTAAFLAARGTPHYLRELTTRTGLSSASTDNHDTSALKFAVLAEILMVGASVLLTDTDVVVMRDPFPALFRDCDVEGMSDGWDEDSAYGFVHTLPVPSAPHGPLRSLRYETRNSGLFFVAATREGLRLAHTLSRRMASEAIWDQSAFNLETFQVALGSRRVAGVSVRTMSFLCVLNTKVLFKCAAAMRRLHCEPAAGTPCCFVMRPPRSRYQVALKPSSGTSGTTQRSPARACISH